MNTGVVVLSGGADPVASPRIGDEVPPLTDEPVDGDEDVPERDGELDAVPEPVVQVVADVDELGALVEEVEPQPEDPLDELELEEVGLAAVVRVKDEAVRLVGRELEREGRVHVPPGEPREGRVRALQDERGRGARLVEQQQHEG